ncbi:hypothetical protein [Nocardioides sp. SYSU DS0663]|uniref:hypothetical protein n=1 Tax=Nocardioides sp. SYSU DS0663 TaxID=3416445 RepID=UPI003F4B34DF
MRALAALGCFLLGAAVAVAAVALHQLWWGLALAAAAALAALVALPAGWWRAPYAAGFVGVLAWTMRARPEGDYLISADTTGYTLLALGLLVLLVALVTLPTRRNR